MSKTKTKKHKCFDAYCPDCGEFSKRDPAPIPDWVETEMYAHWSEEKTEVVAYKRGLFGNSQRAADSWASRTFPTVYQRLHTANYYAWRVNKTPDGKQPMPKGFSRKKAGK